MIDYLTPIQPGDKSSPIDMNAVLRLMQDATRYHNEQPDPELGGLSPDQVLRLTFTPWGAPAAPLQLNAGMTLSDCERSTFFRNMRTFLCALRDAGKVKATTTKRLNRRFVGEMLKRMFPENIQTIIRRERRYINEDDVPGLSTIHLVAKLAGMIRLSKGAFSVPKTKGPLLMPERAGELFRDLFVTFFTRMNLAYLSWSGPEAEDLQSYVGYTLYRLGVVARDWHSVETLPAEILLPQVKMEIEAELMECSYWFMKDVLVQRILAPLVSWGLLEDRQKPVGNYGSMVLATVRVSPLYHHFLRFEFE